MYRERTQIPSSASVIREDIREFFHDHGFNGFHVPVMEPEAWFDGNNPNLETFRKLDTLITTVHQAGGIVHFWLWGDESRGLVPRGGINSETDKRLQRYIAARLGPLPGWSAGYGFDLDEWVTAPQLAEWHRYMQAHLGWFHFLGGRPEGPNQGTGHSTWYTWNLPLDYSSYEHHRPTYEVYVAALEEVPGQPVISEDRFRIRDEGRSKDYTPEDTRRGLYHSTLAGGVANIWGNLLCRKIGRAPPNPIPIRRP